ncbi:hypothetical protein SteCoe_34341 [Stentor coeruleus]|uniref:Uncharacterized protein n=1 Tax=Stentor coeruleus TaxID=5963 RepID=A0A1R2AUQ2_9CILI|nr:hypothetical protein SteCoe_34341 [Stentor coeruleus]
MKSRPLLASTSKQRLEEFRSKLELTLSSKPHQLQDKPKLSESNRKTSPYSRHKDFTDEIKKSISPKRNNSPSLSHYRSLSLFKSSTNSPKAATKPKIDTMKKSGLSYNFDLLSFQEKKPEKLSELISMDALATATSIVTKGGMKNIPKIYAAQLKEFCNEVLANINVR